ncbi:DUF4397 domain-containing protein [uncultured Pseudokineococcus sp.]|uniref:DUF4397 domain-containing protein n=1 Tax=uncultured Pseudokineococcus sp. TaxID=1642928 RepID=UPI002618BB95|nr:DUF4397 domain-containing protein [uncultured Pseudokineococcus sp.]
MSTTTGTTRSRALAVTAAGALVALGALPAAASTSDDATATVSVLHAVPDVPVDVYANGELLIDDFEPGTLTDAQQLPAGEYDLAVYPADTESIEGVDPVVSAEGVGVPAGLDVTVVAHLSESGDPTLTPFVNDTSAVPAGEGRVTVRHVAAAPAVDVLAGDAVVVDGLASPGEESLTTEAGTVSASVNLAGTDTTVIGPADLTVAEGASTIVYAWGSADAGNLQLAVQTVDGMGSDPAGVPSGLGDASTGFPVGLGVLTALAAGGAVLASTTLVRRRSADQSA